MDVKISKKRLMRENLIRISKWVFGLILLSGVVTIIGKSIQPSVSFEEIILSKSDVGNIEVTISASGRVVPAFEQIINSPISSKILKVHAQAGQLLEVGTPILDLDLYKLKNDYEQKLDEEKIMILGIEKVKIETQTKNSESEMNLIVKEMELESMRLELDNQRYLDSLGAATMASVRKAETEFKVAQMQYEDDVEKFQNQKTLSKANERIMELELNVFQRELSELKATLVQAEIKSPSKAVLSFVNNDIGSQISAGQKLAVISDLSHFRVDGEIQDLMRNRISVGRKVYLKLGKNILEGSISNMNPISMNNMINFTVQINDNANPILQSGLNCEIHVVESLLAEVVRIPNGRYYKGAGDYTLFVRDGDMLAKREVALGKANYDYVEVVSGISVGEEVVISVLEKMGEKYDKLKLKE